VSAEGAAAIIAVAIVPLIVLMLSAFVKVSVVLALLRNALGSPQAPPNLVVTGLALLITAFVMAPVADQVVDAVRAPVVTPGGSGPGGTAPGGSGRGGTVPGGSGPGGTAPGGTAPGPGATSPEPSLPQGVSGWLAAAERAQGPIRVFLARHAHTEDRATFVALARDLRGADVAEDDLLVLAAAFVTSELTEAFAIAFLIFLPFLVLDLVVGIGLGALGLGSTPASTVALPLKLILFVAIDGWRLLVDGLARGYT
jgi:type III secretion protein R